MKNLLIFVAAFSVFACSLPAETAEIAQTSGAWTKYEGNPVIGGKLGTVFDVSVLKDGNKYRMWASWRPRKSIALFQSVDGMHWDPPRIALGPTHTGWEDDINRPGVVKKDGMYHMWYTGQASGHSWIGYAISSDGVNWRRVGSSPVLSADTAWEKVAVMCPQVVWDKTSNEFRMWYSGGEQYEPDAIGYATSKDGIHWRKFPANPIFKANPNISWEQQKVTAAQVLEHGDWFYMFYIGFRDIDHAQIGIARSRDGITGWERLPDNPIIRPGKNAWDADACYKPFAIFDGHRWLLWYNGRRGDTEQIGLAIHSGEDLGFGSVVHQTSRPSKNSYGTPEAQGVSSSNGTAPSLGRATRPPIISVLSPEAFRPYVESFNLQDDGKFPSTIPNSEAWKWMAENIPRFDAPDEQLVQTYYFRWWSYRKHIKSTPAGYVITEFLPNVPWAGQYNTINCAAGHHIYEGRWLQNRSYLDDYSKFWLEKGGDVRRYSFWAADAIYARYLANGDLHFVLDLLPALVKNYEAWEKTNLDSNGLFWQKDDRDGMEKSIGGSGYRPTINSYMYGDAVAIEKIAHLAGDTKTEKKFKVRAESLRGLIERELWNPADSFYETRSRESKKSAGVRELIGYIPWYFNLPGPGHEVAWKQLFDSAGFAGTFGPTTAERRSSRFMFSDPHECLWNGPSWPFATTQTLVAMANLLNARKQRYVDATGYFRLLKAYSESQKLELTGRASIPWIDEDLNSDTGEWIARSILQRENRPDRDRGEYYNHSGFADLIITGLVGLRPRPDNIIEVNPLLPPGRWEYFALDSVPYHGHQVSILYDANGKHYGRGKGLRILVDGTTVAWSHKLGRLAGPLPTSTSSVAHRMD